MEALLPAIEDWFATKSEYLTAFAGADCRVEGWFKGELLVLLARLRERGAIEGFEREVNVPLDSPGKRFQIDFKIRFGGTEHLCELKALCISQAAGTPRNLKFYFRDDRVGLIRDMQKLEQVSARNKWLMAFVYPRPSQESWTAAIQSVPAALSHCRPINNPTQAQCRLVRVALAVSAEGGMNIALHSTTAVGELDVNRRSGVQPLRASLDRRTETNPNDHRSSTN